MVTPLQGVIITFGGGAVLTGGALVGLSYGMWQLGEYLDNRRIEGYTKRQGLPKNFDFDREPLQYPNFDPYLWRGRLRFF